LQKGIVPVLQALENLQTDGVDTVKHQLKFCAKWSLDNLCELPFSLETQFPCLTRSLFLSPVPSDGRDFSIDRKKMKSVRVMLSKTDTSGYLKLPRHGLEARSDSLRFESIRATACVTSGSWYYEATLCTSGIMQIGWATRHCQFNSEDGSGVGDDTNSFAFDGCRRKVWHRGAGEPYGPRRWRSGDVVGVLLDLTEGATYFMLNGEDLGNPFQNVERPPHFQELAAEGLYPAISFNTSEHCIFNFGHKPFRYAPPTKYKAFNSAGRLPDSEKYIAPRLVQSRPTSVVDFDPSEPTCQICCERPPNTVIVPCQHQGFCLRCVLQLEKCPICRQDIEDRRVASMLFAHHNQGDSSRPQSPSSKDHSDNNESEPEDGNPKIPMKFSASALSFDGSPEPPRVKKEKAKNKTSDSLDSM